MMSSQHKATLEHLASRNARQSAHDSPAYRSIKDALDWAAASDDALVHREALAAAKHMLDIDLALFHVAKNTALESALASLGVENIDKLKAVVSKSARSSSFNPTQLASLISAWGRELEKLQSS